GAPPVVRPLPVPAAQADVAPGRAALSGVHAPREARDREEDRMTDLSCHLCRRRTVLCVRGPVPEDGPRDLVHLVWEGMPHAPRLVAPLGGQCRRPYVVPGLPAQPADFTRRRLEAVRPDPAPAPAAPPEPDVTQDEAARASGLTLREVQWLSRTGRIPFRRRG